MAPRPETGTEEFGPQGIQLTKNNVERKNTTKKHSKEEDYFEGGGKGSIKWKLGSYKTFQPFAIYITVMIIYKSLAQRVDEPINIPMSRKFLMKEENIAIAMGVLYVLFSLVWGPNMMRNREPIRLKKFMMAYNLFQVIFCSYIFWVIGIYSWFHLLGIMKHDPSLREEPFNLACEPEDRSDSVYNRKIADVCYLYFLAKALDWFDTVFLVLQKKWSHISLLHVFHHMGMFYAAYGFNRYIGSGSLTIVGFINSFVHVILYLYYFLALCGPTVRKFLWWKKYITLIQMVQFIIIAIYGTVVVLNNCEIHPHAKVNLVIYAIGFLALFWDFYKNEYNKKSTIKENGASNNEVNGKIQNTSTTPENGRSKKD